MNKILSLFLILLLSQSVFADSEKAGKHFDKLSGKLDLKEEQVDIVKGIVEEQHQKRREIFSAMKEQMKGLHNETREKLGTVLTAEQLQKFEAMHADRMEKKKKRWEKRKERHERISSESEET